MSAYAGSTAAGSTTTASSRRPTSTVGGKKPSKRKSKKVMLVLDRCVYLQQRCRETPALSAGHKDQQS